MTQISNDSIWRAIIRGFVGRCPNCGEEKLFRAYLKPVDQCAHCGELLGHIRADDGPAWLTIILIGHVLVPVMLMVEQRVSWPAWVSSLVWCAVALLLTVPLLPRAKGVFIAIIWQTKSPGSEPLNAPDR